MNILIGTVLIWAVALWCLKRLRDDAPERMGELRERVRELFVYMLPRIFIGLAGAGFLAALLPEQAIGRIFGAEAGLMGVLIACLAGAVTPGGPFVAFAIGASALKAGAGAAALVAYVSAWSVICLNRSLTYEAPMMGGAFLRSRLLVSWPVPLVLGGIVHALEVF